MSRYPSHPDSLIVGWLPRILVFAAWLLIAQIGHAQDVQYTVSFPDAKAHYVDVRVMVSNPPETLELMMPTWTPGSYLIREYARFVESESASDADGKELPVVKTRKNRWQIECGETKSVRFRYRLYCRELSVRTNWVDSELAVLNGAATFMVPPDRLESPLHVRIQLPDTWPRSVSAMPEDPDQPHAYIASNFHQLVDSPILCGDCHIHPFDIDGVPHALVNLGDDQLWDAQRSVADLKKIVKAHQEFWGFVPYDRYLFLNVVRGGGGGLEHDNCTLIMGNKYTCRSDRSYKSWLTLASHEFFHTWNVRRLRPKTLTQYDYENEVYLRQLWIAEGITSYYENVLVARAGVIDGKELLSRIGREIRSVETTPGNRVQSLSDSSFDTWIKFYRPHENSRNVTISYYGRGAVAAFLLDMKIRAATENEKSLDDVMVQLYQDYVPAGYTSDDFRNVCSQVAGQDLGEWFQKYIDQPGGFEYETALEVLGIHFTDREPREPQVGIGAGLSDSGGRITVRSIQRHEAAYRAGLSIDDEVIAIDNVRLSSSSLSRALEGKKPGDLIQLLIARRDQLKTIPLQLQEEDYRQYQLQRNKEPSDDQKQHFADWLGEELEATGEDAKDESKADTSDSEEQPGDPKDASESTGENDDQESGNSQTAAA